PGRKAYAHQIIASVGAKQALEGILLKNTTGLKRELVAGQPFEGEIKIASAVTLRDILLPFDVVDYLESDIQQSEIRAFPPFMDVLKRKVRRIHIGTHGREIHNGLYQLFKQEGWEIVFNFAPNKRYGSRLGPFSMNDGVLTVRNPKL